MNEAPFLKVSYSPHLQGSTTVSGSKNGSMVTLIASILARGTSVFHNVPTIADIHQICSLLSCLGATVIHDVVEHTVIIDTTQMDSVPLSYQQMKTTRASILLLAPLLARFKKATLGMPGGDAIGSRPIDLHCTALEKMDVLISNDAHNHQLHAEVKQLVGATIVLGYPSVGATENCIMAAVTAKGTTHLVNAALEPEIIDFINALRLMGASIAMHPPATITICGVETLHPIEYTIMPDRLEAGALLYAAALTKGSIFISNIMPDFLAVPLLKLKDMGHSISYEYGVNGIMLKATQTAHAVSIKTGPYPQFPTDLQAPMMALATTAHGTSIIEETVFENRMHHVAQLNRLGASIINQNNTKALITGVPELEGKAVSGNDIRAVCALVLAGLVARGTTQIKGVDHWLRGFESLEEKLKNLGALVNIEQSIHNRDTKTIATQSITDYP